MKRLLSSESWLNLFFKLDFQPELTMSSWPDWEDFYQLLFIKTMAEIIELKGNLGENSLQF